jgi:flavorubredoxin
MEATMTSTSIDEIADGIYRICTPVPESVIGIPGGFTFNQYLIVDDEPLLFHTGPRRMFPLVRDAVARVMPVERLRWVSFSHVESDESGSLNDWLAAAPDALPLCGRTGAMVSVQDLADRPPRVLADGEEAVLGRHRVRWLDTPHLPHNWECGYLFEVVSRTLFCGDVMAHPGIAGPPITDGDVVGPAIAAEQMFKAFARTPETKGQLERLAALEPRTLAIMHGSAYRGDGARALRAFAASL